MIDENEMQPYTLDEVRAQIDEVDEEMMYLLSKRFSLTEEIGAIKAQNGLAIEDEAREAKQYKRLKRLAKELALPEGLEKALWGEIMGAAKAQQNVL